MIAPTLENNCLKISLLDLSNYSHLEAIAQEKDLIYFSPSDITTPEKFRKYVQLVVNGYYDKILFRLLFMIG